MAIDHVLLAVGDLDRGAEQLARLHGLTALPGGRHPGAGTANQIVPLGLSYLELITIADAAEAAGNPLSRRVSSALARRATFAAWAVRVPDVDASSRALDAIGMPSTGPREGSRLRPDGVLLRWRTLHVGDGLSPAIPFLIEWDVPEAEHPGSRSVEHPAGRVSLRSLRLSAVDPVSLRETIGKLAGAGLPIVVEEGPRDELIAVVLDVDGKATELR